MDNIYIWVFLANSQSVLFVALLNMPLCSFLGIVLKTVFLLSKLLLWDEKLFKIFLLLCIYFVENQKNWFQENFQYLEMVGRRKLSDPLLNRIFNVLLNPLIPMIGV